jgi:hypothetical protein
VEDAAVIPESDLAIVAPAIPLVEEVIKLLREISLLLRIMKPNFNYDVYLIRPST